tara:strand:- start:156334 stop:156711 length:378 start_codon:yes stop_codon:yes gene_type:complete
MFLRVNSCADTADGVGMNTDVSTIMSLEVPLVVVLGERAITVHDIRGWVAGSILELGKEAEEDLEVRINNKPIGQGSAVKVGENFGIKFNFIGNPKNRIDAMGPDNSTDAEATNEEELAAAMLDG